MMNSGSGFPVSRRLASVQSPVIPQVAEWVRAHPGCISLGQGVAWYGPPPEVSQAVQGFGHDPADHRYGPVQGIPSLLDLIGRKLELENGVAVPRGQRRIVVTAGANMAFLNAVLAITDAGDEVILPLPYYFNQEMALTMLDCSPVLVPTDDAYQLNIGRIEAAITPRTRAIVTVSPNNPSGAVYPEEVIRGVNALCRQRGLYHITDEAYENFLYDDARHFSAAAIAGSEEHTISLFSLSKAYGFASWRIGYMVIPEHLYPAVLKVQDSNLICAPLVSQRAAFAALQVGSSYCRARLQVTADVRRLVLGELAQHRDLCSIPTAQGAFYLLVRVDTPLDSLTVAERLVRDHGVAVIPGAAFGLSQGCYLRVAYGALDQATARAGIDRLISGLRAVCRG